MESTVLFDNRCPLWPCIAYPQKPATSIFYALVCIKVCFFTYLGVNVYFHFFQGCHSSLGVEDGRIQAPQMRASSEVDASHAAGFGRLYGSSSWCSALSSSSEYLQVDLGQMMTVTGVATQGDPTSDKWVTRYSVQFGDFNTRWFRQLVCKFCFV